MIRTPLALALGLSLSFVLANGTALAAQAGATTPLPKGTSKSVAAALAPLRKVHEGAMPSTPDAVIRAPQTRVIGGESSTNFLGTTTKVRWIGWNHLGVRVQSDTDGEGYVKKTVAVALPWRRDVASTSTFATTVGDERHDVTHRIESSVKRGPMFHLTVKRTDERIAKITDAHGAVRSSSSRLTDKVTGVKGNYLVETDGSGSLVGLEGGGPLLEYPYRTREGGDYILRKTELTSTRVQPGGTTETTVATAKTDGSDRRYAFTSSGSPAGQVHDEVRLRSR